MKLYRTQSGVVVETPEGVYPLPAMPWDALVNRDDLAAHLAGLVRKATGQAVDPGLLAGPLPPPVGTQEIWAAGVTYLRSRQARQEEAREADIYARVYEAQRPELFFKAAGHRVVGHRGKVRIRRDSAWNVPEPELAVLATSSGRIVGYAIGNDMSSRSIEGENPLYLPQAKIYDGACALGPGILVREPPLPSGTAISMAILRDGGTVFEEATTLARMKREPGELVEYLYREMTFPVGALLLTGTGIVPPASFTLHPGDGIRITIEGIGTLVNEVG